METGSEPTTRGGLRSALGWFVFPIVPALLGSSYHQTLNISFGSHGGPDPTEWSWGLWIVLLGPLLGYGFLSGSTIGLSHDPRPRGFRSLLTRSWFRVGAGPWIGFLLGLALYLTCAACVWTLHRVHPPSEQWRITWLNNWDDLGYRWLLNRILLCGVLGILSYGWLLIASVVLREARRQGHLGRALMRGLVGSALFTGSLFGSFWAITQLWREYFFDKKLMPILLLVIGLAMMSGCASQITYGEVRRRELFQAMLLAWLVGMAILWRWWSRPRAKPPL